MKKTYVLDTNVLLDDPNCIRAFEENDLVIPLIVIEEIDRFKDKPGELGVNAREFSRELNRMIKEGGNLREGVTTPSGGIFRVYTMSDLKSFQEEMEANLELDDYRGGDNKIIKVCLGLIGKHKAENLPLPVLVTRDVQLRVKCHVLGIPCEDRRKRGVASSASKLYTGVKHIKVDNDVVQSYYEGSDRAVVPFTLSSLLEEGNTPFHENEYAILFDKNGNELDTPFRFQKDERFPLAVSLPSMYKITARNTEQKIALDMMLDPDIKLVTVIGKAGSGKTLCAVAAGLEQVLERRQYKSLFICRPVQPVGKDIGFLPGDKSEKMDPWIAPIKDNLKYLLTGMKEKKSKRQDKAETNLDYFFEHGIIEVEAMTYIRGRSIQDAYMIIDEAQNLSPHELKTIITRVGENTKIVLTGDIEQIDNHYVDSVSNGLTVAVEKFKDSKVAGHITLVKGERSELATLAAEIL